MQGLLGVHDHGALVPYSVHVGQLDTHMAHAKIINMAVALRLRRQINTEFREQRLQNVNHGGLRHKTCFRKASPAFDFSFVAHFSRRRSIKGDAGTLFSRGKRKWQNYRRGFQNWLPAVKMRTHVERKQGKTEQLQGLVPTLWSCMWHFVPLSVASAEQHWWGGVS